MAEAKRKPAQNTQVVCESVDVAGRLIGPDMKAVAVAQESLRDVEQLLQYQH